MLKRLNNEAHQLCENTEEPTAMRRLSNEGFFLWSKAVCWGCFQDSLRTFGPFVFCLQFYVELLSELPLVYFSCSPVFLPCLSWLRLSLDRNERRALLSGPGTGAAGPL